LTPEHTILLAEGRKPTDERLAPILNDEGYNVITARTRRDTWAEVTDSEPTVIILDTKSIRFSSRRFCESLEKEDFQVPVLLLIDNEEEIEQDITTQSYLQYPFSEKKLRNRVKRLLPTADEEILQQGELILNTKRRHVIRGGQENHLTPKQAQLLETFMRHPGEVLTRAFLMKQVWETDYLGDTRTLDVHIHWLRKAIEKNPKSPKYIRTVRRVGYRFDSGQTKEKKT